MRARLAVDLRARRETARMAACRVTAWLVPRHDPGQGVLHCPRRADASAIVGVRNRRDYPNTSRSGDVAHVPCIVRRLHCAPSSLRRRCIASSAVPPPALPTTVTVGGLTFVNKGLVGVGRLPADLRDRFGETFGSGSGLAVDPRSWMRTPDGYQGTFYSCCRIAATMSGAPPITAARINKLSVTFTPRDRCRCGPARRSPPTSLRRWSIPSCSTDPAGAPFTGLDPSGEVACVRRPTAFRTCRRPRTAASASMPRRWRCCRTAAF